MNISVNENRELVLEEIYNGILLRTRDGNAIGVCMRDDTLEINIIPKTATESNWWRVDMQKGTIEPLRPTEPPSTIDHLNDPGNAPDLAPPKARKLKEGYQPIAPVGYKGPGKPPTGGSGVQRAKAQRPGW